MSTSIDSGNEDILQVELDLVDGRYGELMPIGDIHKGNKGHDDFMYKKFLETLYEEKHYKVLGMGDWIECSTTSTSFRLYDQVLTIDEQIDQIVEDFKPIADEGRLIGILRGNHEATAVREGIDPTHRIAKELGVPNFGAGIVLYVKIGNQRYHVYATHGSSSARTPGGKMNACMRLKDVVEADLYLMGHLHSLDHTTLDIFHPKRKTMELKRRHFVITGSFLKYLGTYAQAKGYPPSGTSGSPKVKFHSDMKRISVRL